MDTLIDDAKDALTTKMNQLTDGAKDSVKKLIDWVTKTNVPVDAATDNNPNPNNNDTNLPDVNPRGRRFSEDLTADKMTANINQGIINVGSTNDAKLDTSYKPNVETDTSKFASVKEMREFVGTPAEKTSNQEMLTSNAMLSSKMDDLIGLARSTNSYLQKISLKDYA